ncbi:MAG: hypothetical protein R2755_08340 [Acidimicrobiales bacterium]
MGAAVAERLGQIQHGDRVQRRRQLVHADGRDRGRVRQERARRIRAGGGTVGEVGDDHVVAAELQQPGGGHGGPHQRGVVHQHHPGAEHADVLVGGLHDLPARCVAGGGVVAGGVLLGGAHVEQERGARRVGQPGLHGGVVDRADAEPLHDPVPGGGGGGQTGGGGVGGVGGLAVGEREPGQLPAHRAVLQRQDRVGDAGVAQRLGADDRAGAAGAVHHHGGVGIGGDVVVPVHQLGTRAVNTAGYGHAAELPHRAGVQDDQPLPGGLAGGEVGGGMGGVLALLDPLAERLGWDVDPA